MRSLDMAKTAHMTPVGALEISPLVLGFPMGPAVDLDSLGAHLITTSTN